MNAAHLAPGLLFFSHFLRTGAQTFAHRAHSALVQLFFDDIRSAEIPYESRDDRDDNDDDDDARDDPRHGHSRG